MKNIKLIVVAMVLTLVCSASYAAEMDLGLDFGISGSCFKIKDDKSAIDNNLGYTVGATSHVVFGKISVGPELWYSHNSANLKGYYSDAEAKIKSNSLDLPVVASMKVLRVINIEAGPSFSLMSKTKVKVGDESYDIGRIKSNVGYVLGAKLTLFKILVIGARFNGTFGCEDVDLGGVRRDIRANTYTISVGAKF